MNKRILVVDDDLSIMESLKYLLEDSGFIVDMYQDSKLFNKWFSKSKPDLILLDYWLPGENGSEITKKLKKSSETQNIPVIIISASYNIKKLVYEAGADDFLQKPYDIEVILQMIEKHTGDYATESPKLPYKLE